MADLITVEDPDDPRLRDYTGLTDVELRRKRGGHLLSKQRFLSAQMEAYLRDGLWLGLAAAANTRADAAIRLLAA